MTAVALLYYGIAQLRGPSPITLVAPQVLGAAAGTFLIVGLWTPLVGSLIAVLEISLIFMGTGEPWIAVLLATLGASVAMIGPGAWSIDARLFGRKHIGPLSK